MERKDGRSRFSSGFGQAGRVPRNTVSVARGERGLHLSVDVLPFFGAAYLHPIAAV